MNSSNPYQETTVDLSGKPTSIITKPGVFGWQGVDPATALLIEHMHIEPQDTVLDLGCGCGVVGLAATQTATQGQVYLVDNDVVALECARRTLERNEVANAQVIASDVTSAVSQVAFDVVVTHLPRGRNVARQFIIDAATVLKPGGRLCLAGHNDTGIKPFVQFAEEVFGHGSVLAYKKGCRVALCVKGDKTQIPASDYHCWHEFTAPVKGKTWSFAAKPGVFSWQELDAGTRALIETMQVEPGERMLDIGCGYGIIGTVAAEMAGEVFLVDSNTVAVEAARRTLALNNIDETKAHILASDGVDAVSEVRFDVAVTNPPFHQGRQTDYGIAYQFIRDAAQVLKPNGRFYLVANRFIRYEHEMAQRFRQVRVAYEDNLFRVLLAQKPKT
ncbi:MAG: methyltransferase [Anaerolineae bacterium]|nr:methyltransferase [Anaerolineae bacterium]